MSLKTNSTHSNRQTGVLEGARRVPCISRAESTNIIESSASSTIASIHSVDFVVPIVARPERVQREPHERPQLDARLSAKQRKSRRHDNADDGGDGEWPGDGEFGEFLASAMAARFGETRRLQRAKLATCRAFEFERSQYVRWRCADGADKPARNDAMGTSDAVRGHTCRKMDRRALAILAGFIQLGGLSSTISDRSKFGHAIINPQQNRARARAASYAQRLSARSWLA